MNDFNGALNESLDDFMESYKITDTEKIYSNGMELVPIFRVKQWFEYNNQDKEIERLHSIIKEVRERINYYENTEWGIKSFDILKSFKKILDKENKNDR